MNRETRELHERLSACELPPGWKCQEAWPWRDGTHLIAPERNGGVVVRGRRVKAQVSAGEIVADFVDIVEEGGAYEYRGRGWRKRIVEAAVRTAWSWAFVRTHYDRDKIAYQRLRSAPGLSAWERLGEAEGVWGGLEGS